MYIRRVIVHCFGILAIVSARAEGAPPQASPPTNAQHQHEASPQAESGEQDPQIAREGSGTAWLPDATPMYAVHALKGPWMVMLHENVFLQYLRESGDRGGDAVGSINWIMGMAQRKVGAGRVMFRGMFSAEPGTIRGCGYPDLLASGEQCQGERIHDLQHPHDLIMELSASYDAPLRGSLRWQAYGGPAGEPALGPVGYPHRMSAMPNLLAPISHHWLDSTHVTFGVMTGGVYGNSWKAEASVFNGREPDEHRTNFDFAALDSVSGRFWFLPTARLALQVSAGHLKEAEAGDSGFPRIDVNRVTASATYHRPLRTNGIWATTIAWGRNAEPEQASSALLIETNVTWNPFDTWFGRFEIVGKTAHDLDEPHSLVHDVEGRELFTVSKLQGGYTRYLPSWNGFQPGIGATVSLGIVPDTLQTLYGSRANAGFGVYLTLRPAMMAMATQAGGASGGAGQTMVMVQTAFDPAKLSCSGTFDPKTAPRTTYEGKTYYFCSQKDRDDFLKDPKMSLSMMPPKP